MSLNLRKLYVTLFPREQLSKDRLNYKVCTQTMQAYMLPKLWDRDKNTRLEWGEKVIPAIISCSLIVGIQVIYLVIADLSMDIPAPCFRCPINSLSV